MLEIPAIGEPSLLDRLVFRISAPLFRRGWLGSIDERLVSATRGGEGADIKFLLDTCDNPAEAIDRNFLIWHAAKRLSDINSLKKTTSFLEASAMGLRQVCVHLLEKGGNPNLRPDPEAPPMMQMDESLEPVSLVLSDDSSLMALFLEKGANPNAIWEGVFPLLHMACAYNDTGDLKTLLKHGADPNIANPCGGRALHFIAGTGESITVWREQVDLLLAAGADVNARNGEGKTPRMLAEDPDRAAYFAELETAAGPANVLHRSLAPKIRRLGKMRAPAPSL